MEEGLPFCKICLEIDLKNNLISPCLCTSHVHKRCLNEWRLRFDLSHVNRIKCTDCKGNYDYEVNPESSFYHRFVSYCYVLAVASILESAACELEINAVSSGKSDFCYFLLLPNNMLVAMNLAYSFWINTSRSTTKKVTMIFAMLFNTVIFLLFLYMFEPPTIIVQPFLICLQSMWTIKNIKSHVIDNRLEGWQLLENDI